MVLTEGEQIHVMTRRLFDGDLRRHFAGKVIAVSGDLARVSGYVFVFDPTRNEYHRRRNVRTRILGLADAGLVIYVIPEDVVLDELTYVLNDQRQLVVTDGRSFSLNINEFTANQ